MNKKRLTILNLLFLCGLSMSSCSFFAGETIKVDTKTTPQDDSGTKKEDTTSEETKQGEEVKEDTKPVEEFEEEPIQRQGKVDTSKETYTVKWNVNGTIVHTDNNVLRGRYPQLNDEIIYPKSNQKSTEVGKYYAFAGWDIENNSNKAYKFDNLAPVVSDTTFYAQFKLDNLCKVTFNFVGIDEESSAALNAQKIKNYDPNFTKLELYFEKGQKMEISDEIFSLIPEYEAKEEHKEFYRSPNYYLSESNGESINQLYKDQHPTGSDSFISSQFGDIEVKSDVEFDVKYTYQIETIHTSFYVNGIKQIFGINTDYDPNGKNTVGSFYADLKKNKVKSYGLLPQSYIVDSKSYKFLGWNKDPNATTGYDITEIPDSCSIENTDYHAIFSKTEYENLCVEMSFKDYTSNKGFIYSELVNNNVLRVSSDNGISFNNSAFATYCTTNQINYNNINTLTISLPSNQNIKYVYNFDGAELLTNITLPSTLEKISNNAFRYLNKLESITNTSTKLTEIGSNAFEYCTSLVKIDGFDSVKTVGESAFANCSKLNLDSEINFETIGSQAFKKCTSDHLKIGSKVKTIGKQAFSEFQGEEVTIAEGITSLSDKLFENSTFKTVNLPSTVKNLGEDYVNNNSIQAFYGCKELTKYNINSKNTTYIATGDGLVKISGGVLVSGNENTVITKNIKQIGDYAFGGSSIKKIRIPSTVTSVSTKAFCKSDLNRIDYDGTISQLEDLNNFYGVKFYLIDLINKVNVYCTDENTVERGKGINY